MRVISEGPIKITKATIDASWRRRKAGQRLIVRDKDCRGLALIVNPTVMTWTLCLPAARDRSRDGPALAEQDSDAGQSRRRIPPMMPAPQPTGSKGQAAAGADPAADKKIKAATEQRKRAATLGRLIDDYAQSLATAAEDARRRAAIG